MAIDVRSEVRPLKKVLLQRPGRELEQLVPNSMERLLFDDIPYLRGAQTEHDRICAGAAQTAAWRSSILPIWPRRRWP